MWDVVIKIGVGIAAAIIGAAAAIVVVTIIDKVTLQKTIKEKYQNAAKAIIKSKDTKTVVVGIYDSNNNTLAESMKIQSDNGVSNDIKEGQILYM